jgi:hypothetical protein
MVVPPTAKIISSVGDQNYTSGRKEIGYYLEILPGSRKTFNFVWEESIENNRQYQLYWHRQPGLDDENVSLTVDGVVVYNTVFTKDILWKSTP